MFILGCSWFTSCVILGKFLNISEPYKIVIKILITRIHIWDPNRIFYFSVFLSPPHSSKRTMTRKHWLGKYCIIIITISLRKVACSLNIQHHNYNFHKECRTVIINNTIITWSIRENRLQGGVRREKKQEPVF